MTIENCFLLLKLADEYQMEFLLQKCEDFLVAASSSICVGRLRNHEYFTGFSPQTSKPEKDHNNCTAILTGQALSRLLT